MITHSPKLTNHTELLNYINNFRIALGIIDDVLPLELYVLGAAASRTNDVFVAQNLVDYCDPARRLVNTLSDMGISFSTEAIAKTDRNYWVALNRRFRNDNIKMGAKIALAFDLALNNTLLL